MITEDQYHEAQELLQGYCTNCNELVNDGSVEPDAERYTCEQCETATVYGVEQALLLGLLEVE